MTQDFEALAQQLEQHPDYKVLRRLTPQQLITPELAGQKMCKGVVLDTETT
ncbi:MAG: DNA polymerase III subunit epsilon, partial [Betaproteobacteria bacterium]|nr:DNA polymerase III subunit epsilon [Betaproteobacteria bacterium]